MPLEESEIPIQFSFNGFDVMELLSEGLYSMMIIYQGNIIFNRATFRRSGCCSRYKNKRALYIADLETELGKLNLSY